MADVEIRGLRPDEAPAFVRSARIPFLDPAVDTPEDRSRSESWERRIETDRAWVGTDAERFVANSVVYTMDVSVPAGASGVCPVLPMGGVSAVGVHPTHRRRGLLTGMMARMLEDCRSRREPLAGLIASESSIYGRYGFGLATESVTATIESRRGAMLRPAPRLDLRLFDMDEAAKVLPEMYDRFRTTRAGEPSLGASRWEAFLADDPADRHGASALMIAGCDEGYVEYRAKSGPDDDAATLTVLSLRAKDAEAEAGLWQFLFEIDLAERVVVFRRPVDEPLRWRLADPRQLHLTDVDDRLYIRVLDVPGAFEGRGYTGEGRLVIDVVPPPADGADDPVPGRWVLEAGPDGASCRRASPGDDADLRLDVTALGSLYMGAFPASLLAAAGRVEELKAGRLLVADHLLTTRPAPLTVTGF